MKKRQIYNKIRVRENLRDLKSESAGKLEAQKLKAHNLKGAKFNRNKVSIQFFFHLQMKINPIMDRCVGQLLFFFLRFIF